MTARSLIKSSLRLIGAISSGENPSSDEASDSLEVLNMLLDLWSTNKLLVFSRTREVFALTPTQSSYTIGPSSVDPLVNFDTARPVQILNVSVITSSDPKLELPIQIATDEEWAKISIKDLQSTLPKIIYPMGNAPIETFYVYPVPSEAREIAIYSMKQLLNLTSLDDELNVPPGYLYAMKYNLAVELATEFSRQLDPMIVDKANKSIAQIKRLNSKPIYMKSDAYGLSEDRKIFNWMTGE